MADEELGATDRRELIEMIGRQTVANGRELTCGVYLTTTGYEVRAEYADGEVVRTQWAMDTQGARIIANRWVDELGLERAVARRLDRRHARRVPVPGQLDQRTAREPGTAGTHDGGRGRAGRREPEGRGG